MTALRLSTWLGLGLGVRVRVRVRVDGAGAVHLLQLEHEWLQVDVISVALHATDEVEHLEGVAYEVPG